MWSVWTLGILHISLAYSQTTSLSKNGKQGSTYPEITIFQTDLTSSGWRKTINVHFIILKYMFVVILDHWKSKAYPIKKTLIKV